MISKSTNYKNYTHIYYLSRKGKRIRNDAMFVTITLLFVTQHDILNKMIYVHIKDMVIR